MLWRQVEGTSDQYTVCVFYYFKATEEKKRVVERSLCCVQSQLSISCLYLSRNDSYQMELKIENNSYDQ